MEIGTNQRFASGLYPILDRKQLAVALSVFGARSSAIPHTVSEVKGPIFVFFECRNEFQELEFFTKAYTILDGKMMLSEIEVLQY